jgi:hypothetical protein
MADPFVVTQIETNRQDAKNAKKTRSFRISWRPWRLGGFLFEQFELKAMRCGAAECRD